LEPIAFTHYCPEIMHTSKVFTITARITCLFPVYTAVGQRRIRLYQWRSQALKSGWAHGVWGWKSASRVQGRSSGGGLGRSSQKSDIYKQFAVNVIMYVQSDSVRCICRSVAESVLHLPYPPPPKNLRICANPTAGAGYKHRCPPVSTRLYATGTCLKAKGGHFEHKLPNYV